MALWAVRTRLTASVHVNLRGGWFSAIIRHADGPSEKRSRFYPTRATRERNYTKHARNPKPFSFRKPDLGHAVHCRARAQRFSRSASAQGARLDYSGAKSAHHRRPDLWTDSRGDVRLDRADHRRPCFPRYALGQYFKKSRKICLARAGRLDDRRAYYRW